MVVRAGVGSDGFLTLPKGRLPFFVSDEVVIAGLFEVGYEDCISREPFVLFLRFSRSDPGSFEGSVPPGFRDAYQWRF